MIVAVGQVVLGFDDAGKLPAILSAIFSPD